MSISAAQCPATDVLEGLAIGGLADASLETHLASCDACRTALQRIRDDNRFLSSFAVAGALPTQRLPEAAQEIEVPGYQIIREVHRGGQGVVYQAVQHSTRRDVAIKVMRQGPFATLADRGRFEREIETLGRLDHPNIVAVHDAGVAAGFHYFVMNYVDGKTLDEAILDFGFWILDSDRNVPRAADVSAVLQSATAVSAVSTSVADPGSPGSGTPIQSKIQNPKSKIPAVLGVFIKVCDAVHAAHLRGIIHRDLKPSNIRVSRSGEPFVLDFGLAKSTDAERDSAMTRTGQFVGSLPWASPEQLEGASAKIDLRTDVYSLGAILFQLLTGSLPFDVGTNLRDAFDSILLRDPPRPSAVSAEAGGLRIDDELDTIVLKCLSKDRERRYQSAGELSRDLRRYLAGDPIEAKRDSALYVLRKTLRRYRLPFAFAGAFVVLLTMFAVTMALLYRRSVRLEQQAVQSAFTLNHLLTQSNVEQGRMAGMLGNLKQAEQLLWRELLTHREPGAGAIVRLNDPPGPPEAYWALWELYRRQPCRRTLTPMPLGSRTATLASDGRSLWTADQLGSVQRLDEFGAPLESYRMSYPNPIGVPLLDPTGTIIVKPDGDRFRVWRRGHADPAFEFPLIHSLGGGLQASRSGRFLAAVIDGAAIIRSTDTGATIASFDGDTTVFTAVGISDDERLLAARDALGGLYVWEIESRRRIAYSPGAGPSRNQLHNTGELRFAPDGRQIADAWEATNGRIWNLDRDPPVASELSEAPGSYRLQSFSPDGHVLAIANADGGLRFFDVQSGQRTAAFPAHLERVHSVSFTGDGRGIWTCAGPDLKLWDATPDAGIRTVRIPREPSLHSVEFNADGRSFLIGAGYGTLSDVDLSTLAITNRAMLEHDATIAAVAVSPDGRRIAAATYARAVHVWDAQHPEQPPMKITHPHRVSSACFTPDGRLLATACDDSNLRLWNAADGTLEREFPGDGTRVPQIAFDPTGRRLAAALRNGALVVWLIDTGTRETWAAPTQSALRAVRFSPDGRWLATGGAQRTVDVWDAALRQRVATLVGHNQEVYCLDISPDGALIASGDSGGMIRLWHAGLRRPLATLDGHTASVMSLRFAPDGRTLISASLDGTVRVWDLAYYEQHIAGNVATQLGRLGAAEADPQHTAAWLQWANSHVLPRTAQPSPRVREAGE